MQRSENAMSKTRGQIGPSALKGLQAFHKRTADKLARQISCFTNLLKETTDPKKQSQITRWLAGWGRERSTLYHRWMKSRVRSGMIEDYPYTTKMMDEVLEFNQNSASDKTEREYRKAGQLIRRLKSAR